MDKTFFSFQIDIAESTDPDNEGSLKYQLFVDDVNATEEKFGSTVTIGAGSTRHDDLQGNTTYKVQVRATDRKGGKTFSNTLEITTDPTPPSTFTVIEVVPGPTSVFTLPEIYSKVGYNVNSFYLDGEKFTLDGIYSTNNEDGSRTFHFDKEDIPETNTTYNLEFEVGWHSTWNSNTGQTYYSKSVNQGLQLRVNEYSPTSADVQTVYLYGPNHATAPLQFIVKFHDNKLSDYEDYDIYSVKIGGIEVKNYFANQIGSANEVSLTGSVTLEEYNTIKENPNNSRVVTIDESGYHALTEYSIAFEE
ncbi:hypothetical protein [Zobellia uliginosa]|uniref:hypothetical protein n=1 Tax=Zobellia uliginosa TaxID=143224 RepID=UPI0011158898|nr:hypothetical protein [Zobellia uliginosa]